MISENTNNSKFTQNRKKIRAYLDSVNLPDVIKKEIELELEKLEQNGIDPTMVKISISGTPDQNGKYVKLETLSHAQDPQTDQNVDDSNLITDSVESEISQTDPDSSSDSSSNSSSDSKDSAKNENKTMDIEYYGTDLTQEYKNGFIDPIIGREKEINQVIYTLLRKTKNNPLLIGEPGVWKTAIVEGLAQRIVQGNVPIRLKGKRIFLLDMGTLVAWTKYRGEFESRMKNILDEAMNPANNIILFIDELHTIIGAWWQDHNDAAQMLKPILSRGKIRLIWATTFDEYQKIIEKDAALKRRFQEVVVNEPSNEVAFEIISWLRKNYEDFHGVIILDEAIHAAINLSKRYILNKQLPDKALDILDEACARESTMQEKLETNKDYTKIEKQLEKIQGKIDIAINEQDYFTASDLKEKQEKLKKELQKIRSFNDVPMDSRSKITASMVGNVLAEKTGIPVNIVNEDEITKLKRLKNILQKSMIGQEEAVNAVVKTLTRSRLSMIESKKPIGSFFFLGPSWVGKTYLAKLIAKDYFWDESAMIRFDMSEFMEKASVSKLIWSPAWYIGYDEWWWLTEAVRRKPYSVILFDEVEKASTDVLNLLLQILDEGQLKDSKWRLVDFKSTIIVMTSNIWCDEFSKKQVKIWFSTSEDLESNKKDFDEIKERVFVQLKKYLSPELLNRIDYKVVFKPLTKEELASIFKIDFAHFSKTWEQNPLVKLPKYSDKKIKEIIDKIYDPQYGARPIERYFSDTIEPEMIEQLMK